MQTQNTKLNPYNYKKKYLICIFISTINYNIFNSSILTIE